MVGAQATEEQVGNMALPIQMTNNQDLILMQNRWAAQLNPLLAKPTSNSSILKQVSLAIGTNVIDHKLGRPLQGWKLTRQRAAASIHDNQDNNQTPQLTLTLVSDAAVVVDLEVF